MSNDGITFVQTSRLFRYLMDFFNILPKRHYKNPDPDPNQINLDACITLIMTVESWW